MRLTLIWFFRTRLCPVDTILTRMGAYDNMFSNASTFKVELDEWWVSPHQFRGRCTDAHLSWTAVRFSGMRLPSH